MKNRHVLITRALLLEGFFASAQTVRSTAHADRNRGHGYGYIVSSGNTAPAGFELQVIQGAKTSLSAGTFLYARSH